MHLKSISIRNIRSLRELDVEFQAPYAGWHVFIGDNGVGKSSVIRSIALGLIGPDTARALHVNPNEWLTSGETSGCVSIAVLPDDTVDKKVERGRKHKGQLWAAIKFIRNEKGVVDMAEDKENSHSPDNYFWGKGYGWFSTSFGPFRRFTGGSPEWERLFVSDPKAAAHVSGFREDVALGETLRWLKNLEFDRLKHIENFKTDSSSLLYNIRQFINSSGLLPHNATFDEVDSQGPVFRDGNGNRISVVELSDGFRSVLSLLLELLRQFLNVYGEENLFKNGNNKIDLPGIVLIDEVDAHLHPSWQTRIGDWFTSHFPDTQFIITTHSPLVCRASANGSIWKLPAPHTNEKAHEITGTDRERLIYGDVLDAYSTELFGHAVDQSSQALVMKERLAHLGLKQSLGVLSESEAADLKVLANRFTSILSLNPRYETVEF